MCWSCLGVLISSRTGILEEMLFLISHNLKICVLEMNKKWFTFSSELIDMNREKGRVRVSKLPARVCCVSSENVSFFMNHSNRCGARAHGGQ